MITGAHTILYSKNPEADKIFFRDVLKFNNVDVGNGWLIFALPDSEIAMHPGEENNKQEFYLMCDDINDFIAEMKNQNIPCSEIHDERWGMLVHITLPGGSNLGVYQPKHARPSFN